MSDLFEFEENTVSSILTAIKKDDKKAFTELTANSKYLSLCYGNFPVLSLLYLYNSNKILSRFERDLILIKTYIFAGDDIETNHLFKTKAKRSIRLFTNNQIVTPALMLAVLGYDYKLSYFLKHNYLSESEEDIIKTYALSSGKEAKFIKGKLYVEKDKLSKKEVATVSLALILSLAIVFISFGLFTYTKTLPTGSVDSPYLINNANTLLSCLNDNDSIKLSSNIEVSNTSINEYTGNIDGCGHTLILSNLTSPFIQNLNGSISNLNVIILDSKLDVTQSIGLFVNNNKGTLSNIYAQIKSCSFNIHLNETYEETGTITRYISTFNCFNQGVIDSCKFSIDNVNLLGDPHTDSVYGTICAYNKSSITNCELLNGNIDAQIVDLGGLVGYNSSDNNQSYAQIKNCTNKATISQTTSIDNWSLHAAGICFINDDIIEECKNFGNITINALGANSSTSYVGGIAAKNNGYIGKSLNKGNVAGINNCSMIYAGGITGYSASNYSEISYCGSSGKINVSVPDNTFTFVGGIVGQCEGYFGYNYSSMEFNVIASENYNCTGGLIGIIYSNFSTGTNYLINNNYYLKQTNLVCGIASYLQYDYWYMQYNVYPLEQEYYSTQTTNMADIEALEYYIG